MVEIVTFEIDRRVSFLFLSIDIIPGMILLLFMEGKMQSCDQQKQCYEYFYDALQS